MPMLKGVGMAIAVVFVCSIAHMIVGAVQHKVTGVGYFVAEVGPMFITTGALLAAFGSFLMLKYR